MALALKAVATLVTPEIAHQLIPEIKTLLRHTKPYIRKRAILALYRLVVVNPDCWISFQDKLKEELSSSSDSPNQHAIVTVMIKTTTTSNDINFH